MSDVSVKEITSKETDEDEKVEPGNRFLRELSSEEWKNYWNYTSYHHYY